MPPEAIRSAAAVRESVLPIRCGDADLPGILSHAEGTGGGDVGVLIVVGGPQYRVGSHRQFVQLARALARAGLPTLRFDYRGMGDADGVVRDFESAGADLHAAIDAFRATVPQVRRVVLWGLCDAASLVTIDGCSHPGVAGLAIANPWVRSAAGVATATVKHYYRARLLQPELWRKVLTGRFDWRASLGSAAANLRQMFAGRGEGAAAADFQTRMARGLAGFAGPVLLLISEEDLTAREFLDYTASAPAWKGLLQRPTLQRLDLPGSDHTFSRREWKARVEQGTIDWIMRTLCTR